MSTANKNGTRPRRRAAKASRLDQSSVPGLVLLVFLGFVLAGALTVFLAFSLRHQGYIQAGIHAALLWFAVNLIHRNLDNLAQARSRPSRPGRNRPAGRS